MPHIHMKVWIENAPIIGKNSNEEIIAFINKYISCKLTTPNEKLNFLINKFQIHQHTPSCERYFYNEFFCRHGFPKTVSDSTTIENLNLYDLSLKKSIKNFCYFISFYLVNNIKMIFN
jgi:hypothetical protein